MIPYEEALDIVLRYALPLDAVDIELERAGGSYIAQAVRASSPMPRFDSSSVDGYGVNAADTAMATARSPVQLPVKRTIRAGDVHGAPLEEQTVIKIFTGATIPAGVNAVVMREDVEESDSIVVTMSVPPGANIRKAGAEFHAGELVIAPGSRITPATIGLIAQLGLSTVKVHRRPSVALIVNGNELVSSGAPLTAAQIYDSNSPSLVAALHAVGVQTVRRSVVGDSPKLLRDALSEALQTHDLVITAGGVSVGDCDYVRMALNAIGVQQRFWQVAIKPGKPNYFGTFAMEPKQHKLVFGLPGNPVSALVSFLLFVRPGLLQMMGDSHPTAELFTARVSKETYSELGRLEFLRGRLTFGDGEWRVQPCEHQGSHMLSGLATADCLIHCPPDVDHVAAGDMVTVQRIERS